MPSIKNVALVTSLLLVGFPVRAGQQSPQSPQQSRHVWFQTRDGHILSGDLVKLDPSSLDFTVKGILQSIPYEDLTSIAFQPIPTHTPQAEPIYQMSDALRPKILQRDAALYTVKARDEKIQGRVVLQVVFAANGKLTNIVAIKELPHGLTEQAMGTAYRIKFTPAMKDGKPVSVRGNLEFAFNLY